MLLKHYLPFILVPLFSVIHQVVFAQIPIPVFEGKEILHSEQRQFDFGEIDILEKKPLIQNGLKLNESFESFDLFEFPASKLSEALIIGGDSLEFVMKLGERHNWRIVLFSDNFVSPTLSKEFLPPGTLTALSDFGFITYKGYIQGKEKSSVRLTINSSFIQGFISVDNERLFVENANSIIPEMNDEQIISYLERDILEEEALNCSVENFLTHDISEIDSFQTEEACNGVFEVEVAIAATNSFYQGFKKNDTAMINHVLSVINSSQEDFDRFNVRFVVVEFIVFSNEDPNDRDIDNVFSGFSNWARDGFKQAHDVGICFFDGKARRTIGKAWLGAVCTSRSYCVVDKLKSAAANRTLLSHELGHNFSANHEENGANIMKPKLNVTDVWATGSIKSIEKHISTRNCLACIKANTPKPDSIPEPEPGLKLSVKVSLEGLIDNGKQVMRTNLWEKGILPKKQPFQGPPFNYSGKEEIVSDDADIVDWMFLELRDVKEITKVIAKKAAVLTSNGTVRDVAGKGSALVSFKNISEGSYKLAIYQRNHLAILSEEELALKSENPLSYDFTIDLNKAEGNNQLKKIQSQYSMHGGDFDQNGVINNLDFNLWKNNAAAVDTYLSVDADGNGIINNIDFNIWKNNRSKIGIAELKK